MSAPTGGSRPGESSTPFFVFIGPDKVGSTWLGEQLDRHPTLQVSRAKDLYFFDQNYNRGWAWYARQFKSHPDQTVLCDISHDYLFSTEAAHRIKRDIACPRILCVVRSPLERSFSQFLNFYRAGKAEMSFERAIELHPKILTNSKYSTHLPVYAELFDSAELRVITYDDIKTNPQEFLRAIFDFIGVEQDCFDYQGAETRVNEAGMPRSRFVASLAKDGADLVRRMGLPRVIGAVKSSSLASHLYRNFDERPRLTADHIERYGHFFEADVDYLESTFGFDLTEWRHDLGLV